MLEELHYSKLKTESSEENVIMRKPRGESREKAQNKVRGSKSRREVRDSR
jgi:hypothetical protein